MVVKIGVSYFEGLTKTSLQSECSNTKQACP